MDVAGLDRAPQCGAGREMAQVLQGQAGLTLELHPQELGTRILGAQQPKETKKAEAKDIDELKEQLRSEIVGATVFPGEEKEYVVGVGDILGVSIYGEGDMAALALLLGQVSTLMAGIAARNAQPAG